MGVYQCGRNIDGIAEYTGGQVVSIFTLEESTYDIRSTDYIIHVVYTITGPVTSLTLPLAQSRAGRVIIVKDAGGNAGSNNITVDTEGSETIDGDDVWVINGDYDWVVFYSNGLNWFLMG